MKHFGYALCLLLPPALLPCTAWSQEVGFGLRLGWNSASAKVDPELSLDARPGMLVGALVNTSFITGLGAQAEVRYAQRGSRFAFPSPLGLIRGTYDLDFIQFPLLLRGSYGGEADPVRAYAVAGPTVGLLFSAHASGTIGGMDTSAAILDNFKSTEVSLELGGGTEFTLSPTISFAVDARVALGMTDIIETSNFGIVVNEMRLNDIQINAAVIFRL